MVSTLLRPQPTGWLPAHDHPVQPAAAGGYTGTSGEQLLSAHEVLNRVFPHSPLHAQRNPVIRRACVAYANSLHNPDVNSSGPWSPAVAPFTDHSSSILPLVQHRFWEQLEVLAAPIHLRHRRLPLATSAELLVRFRTGGDLGIGICQTAPREQLNPFHLEAEVGAAVALLADTWGWFPTRSFVLFCRPEQTTVELVDVDRALGRWVDAIEVYRWTAKNLGWEKQL